MKATWKKIWYPDGSTLELVDGKAKPEFECIMLTPPPEHLLKSQTWDVLMDRKTAEEWIARWKHLTQSKAF